MQPRVSLWVANIEPAAAGSRVPSWSLSNTKLCRAGKFNDSYPELRSLGIVKQDKETPSALFIATEISVSF